MAINNLAENALIISVNNTKYSITKIVSMPELSSVSKYLCNTKGEFKENNSTVFSLQISNVSDNNKKSAIINTKYLHRNEMQKLQIRSRLCCYLQPWKRILICKLP